MTDVIWNLGFTDWNQPGSLCWLEDAEEIRMDEYDRLDAAVDQVEPDAGIIQFG